MDEDYFHIFLKCKDCDHPTCRLKQIVHSEKEGCVRQVDEDLFIEHYHQLKEVWPFILKSQNKEKVNKEYEKTMQILDKVYNSPYTKRYGRNFKVVVGV